MKKFSEEKLVFAGIILIASVLRLWNYWGWSYTHDELGAFVRLNHSSFSELITQGVRDTDTHPALVQLFLWIWTKLFGLSEAAVRLPFVIAGIASVALLYLIAKKWFGYATACFASLSLAILDFPVLYSQLARPYSFGLFFCLLTVFCWTNLLFGTGKNIYRKVIFYGTATALCMLTHYFAFFFSVIVAGTGLFFLKKENWKPYLLSGFIAIVLFLPHLSVSLHQFSMGGLGQWLSKPGKYFLWKYILYGFNDSPVLVVTVAIIVVLSLLMYHLDISISRFQTICVIWFLVPFLAGYYYSVYVNPVLQYSTLIFSFPFLLLFLFSFFKETRVRFNKITLGSLGIILLFSTVVENKFYKREDFGVFKELDKAAVELQKKYGAQNITTVFNTSGKEIFDFYFKQANENMKFDFFAGDDSSYIPEMLKKVDACKSPYFMYGWSNFRSPYEIPEIIKRKYPCILYDEKHFNSEITLFGPSTDSCRRDTVFFSEIGFENFTELKTKASPYSSYTPVDDKKTGPRWAKYHILEFDSTKADTTLYHSGKHALKIDAQVKFCVTLKTSVKNIFPDNTGCVNVSAWVYTQGKFDAQLVMDVGQPTGKHDWQAKLLPKFITSEEGWHQVFATFEIPAGAYPDDEVKIHLWNPGKNSFSLDDVIISAFADSKYDYYKVSYRK